MKKLLKTKEYKKFDVVLGNPPFSVVREGKMRGKRSRELYVEFFRLALALGENVGMVLPSTARLLKRGHNDLLQENANVLVELASVDFGVCIALWYVIVDGSGRVPMYKFDLYDKRNGICWEKGRVNMTWYKKKAGDHGREYELEGDVTIYHKVSSRGFSVRYGSSLHFRAEHYFPESGYALLLPQTISDRGWGRVELVKCTGKQVAFNGMTIVFVDREEVGLRLLEYMRSEDFVNQCIGLRQGFNQMTLVGLRAVNIPEEIEREIFR